MSRPLKVPIVNAAYYYTRIIHDTREILYNISMYMYVPGQEPTCDINVMAEYSQNVK